MDSDLPAAEKRGITHSFLFWHGPEWPMGGHCCTTPTQNQNITAVINKHPSVSATFHGHEHNLAYAHMTSAKIANITHEYEEFTVGGAGASLYGCQRGEWCQNAYGFAIVDVNGSSFTLNFFIQTSTLLKSFPFTKGTNPTPTSIVPTATPSTRPTSTPTTRPTATPTTNPLPTSTPVPGIPTSTPRPATPTPTATPRPATPTPTIIPGTDVQPTFPIRAAFYYPWFPEAWTQVGHYPYTKFHPTLGFYSGYDKNTVIKHINMMQYGKIQAGIASWWGQGQHADTKIPNLLRAADGTNFKCVLYYENESQGDPAVSQIQNDINYIDAKYAHDTNYLRVAAKPVLFVYADANDACGMADRWKQANTKNFYIVLKVFPGYANCASQPQGWHQYSPAVREDSQGTYSFAISPSFDKYGETTRLGRDLNAWILNIAHMRASNAKFQLVTTFNEWGEGSSVEPATEWGSSSTYGSYLDALHNDGAPIPTTPPNATPTLTPTPTKVNTPTPTPIPLTGDANNDKKINDVDFSIWKTHYLQSTANGAADGDFNRDSKVDGSDYVIWLNSYTG